MRSPHALKVYSDVVTPRGATHAGDDVSGYAVCQLRRHRRLAKERVKRKSLWHPAQRPTVANVRASSHRRRNWRGNTAALLDWTRVLTSLYAVRAGSRYRGEGRSRRRMGQ